MQGLSSFEEGRKWAELFLEVEGLKRELSTDPREKYSMRVTTSDLSHMIRGDALGSWFGWAESLKGSGTGGSKWSFGEC